MLVCEIFSRPPQTRRQVSAYAGMPSCHSVDRLSEIRRVCTRVFGPLTTHSKHQSMVLLASLNYVLVN